MVPHVSILKDL